MTGKNSISNFGNTIAALRRELGITQEALAVEIGVSPQAVSKWENGGTPDVELLPVIADFFDVSVDHLLRPRLCRTFTGNIEDAVYETVSALPPEKRIGKVFDLCLAAQDGFFSELFGGEKEERIRLSQTHGRTAKEWSSVKLDSGTTQLSLRGDLRYFMLLPDVDDPRGAFLSGVDYCELFSDLSDRDVFDSLVFFNQRENRRPFTPAILEKQLGLSAEKAEKVIKVMDKYGLLYKERLEMDDGTGEKLIYRFLDSFSFIAMLIFAREVACRPTAFLGFIGSRIKPYL